MNIIDEQVSHSRFGIGSILEQTERMITVKFVDEYGIKMFQYPVAFDKYLSFCSADLQDKIRNEIRLITEQIDNERKLMEEEYLRSKEEQRIHVSSSKQASSKKRAVAKRGTATTSLQTKKQELPLDNVPDKGKMADC